MSRGGRPAGSARDGGVLTLTLNRPDKRNALSSAVVEALHQALDAADLDAEVRVVVLTGAGKDFCAGADLEELLASADASRRRRTRPPRSAWARCSAACGSFPSRWSRWSTGARSPAGRD